jgi:hypothetical protein
MVQRAFFLLGIANNAMLIAIFLIRGRHLALLERFGWVYLLLGLPALYLLLVALRAHAAYQYSVFLGIFLAFLALEGLLEFVLRTPFRQDWRLLTPYLLLYFAMNYGFVAMSWKASPRQGGVMLVLFVGQIVTNMLTH